MMMLKFKSVSKEACASYKLYLQKKLTTLNSKLIFLPIKTTRLTLLKSPHVYKKAREQFEVKQYSFSLFLSYINPNLFISLSANKPSNLQLTAQYLKKK